MVLFRQLTTPYTPQQNGVAETRSKTLLHMIRSMMALENLLISFWRNALLIAAYVLNKMSSTPYELWIGHKTNLNVLRPWGCATYIKDHLVSLVNSVKKERNVSL